MYTRTKQRHRKAVVPIYNSCDLQLYSTQDAPAKNCRILKRFAATLYSQSVMHLYAVHRACHVPVTCVNVAYDFLILYFVAPFIHARINSFDICSNSCSTTIV